jgi:CRP/FNR family cyclic AMP-dependent transcriptional regulator
MSDIRSFLSAHEIFSSLNTAQQTLFQNEAISRSYPKGAFITQHGDIWPYLFIITKGQINAIKESSEGRSLTLATIDAGDFFWGLAFFIENAPMPAALKATEKCELLLWSRDDLLPFIFENGRFSWELSRLMVQRVQFASEIVEKLAFQPLTGRVARLLLEQFPASQNIAPRHLTLDEMASRVGTTREMVCRILYRFAEVGAIQINRTEFIFTDRAILEDFSKNTG